MDKNEAKIIGIEEISRYRNQSYQELQRLLTEVEAYEHTSAGGKIYGIEVHAIWDDKINGNLRVFCEVSSGLWSSIFPYCQSFIIGSDGGFIDEK